MASTNNTPVPNPPVQQVFNPPLTIVEIYREAPQGVVDDSPRGLEKVNEQGENK